MSLIPPFCRILPAKYAIIFSQEYAYQLSADDNLTQLDTHPVGTGPYQVKDYVYNQYVRLVRNEIYWKKEAKNSKILSWIYLLIETGDSSNFSIMNVK